MSNHHEKFLDLYKAFRHDDQAKFYRDRHEEFEKARRQAVILTGALMFLTAVVSALMVANLFWPKPVWAILSVVLPALSAALAAYTSILAFERQSKLYQDAHRALRKAEAGVSDLKQAPDEADYKARLESYVKLVEEILRKEQGQWGQLISEIKLVEAPKPKGPAK
jgi:hypothetical protein